MMSWQRAYYYDEWHIVMVRSILSWQKTRSCLETEMHSWWNYMLTVGFVIIEDQLTTYYEANNYVKSWTSYYRPFKLQTKWQKLWPIIDVFVGHVSDTSNKCSCSQRIMDHGPSQEQFMPPDKSAIQRHNFTVFLAFLASQWKFPGKGESKNILDLF